MQNETLDELFPGIHFSPVTTRITGHLCIEISFSKKQPQLDAERAPRTMRCSLLGDVKTINGGSFPWLQH